MEGRDHKGGREVYSWKEESIREGGRYNHGRKRAYSG